MRSYDHKLDSVAANNAAFYENFKTFLENYAKTTFKKFTSDEVRQAYEKAGNIVNGNTNAIGPAFRILSREKKIYFTGEFQQSKLEQSHDRYLRVWISREYRLQQQANATKDKTLKLF